MPQPEPPVWLPRVGRHRRGFPRRKMRKGLSIWILHAILGGLGFGSLGVAAWWLGEML